MNAADRESASNPGQERLWKIRQAYPRAYERWTAEEEARLLKLQSDGLSIDAISEVLQRQPGGIRSRFHKLEEDASSRLRTGMFPRDEEPVDSPLLGSGETLFLPLAVSAMQGEAVCVAGLNMATRHWVRLVRRSKHALFSEDSSPFLSRQLMRVKLGDYQPRPYDVDPLGLHVEDRVLMGDPAQAGEATASDKIVLLESMIEGSLERSLLQKRSLFLIKPASFRVYRRPTQTAKIAFSTADTDTDALRESNAIGQNKIGISSVGCPCTCLAWSQSGSKLDHVRTESDIERAFPGASTFFVLSLTGWPTSLPIERQKHYLLVAGVHVIGRDRIWL